MSEHVLMVDVLKYAVVERERRFVVAGIPEGVTQTLRIEDYYIEHTRLRLRQVTAADGSFTRKFGHKVRLGQDASAIACTSTTKPGQEPPERADCGNSGRSTCTLCRDRPDETGRGC
jgi:hypothetical protein